MRDELTIDGVRYRRVTTKEEEPIEERYERVPDNIHFDPDGDLLFNDDKQVLYERHGEYGVWNAFSVSEEERFLVPCEHSELELGDVAYSLKSFRYKDALESYKVILKEDLYAYVSHATDVTVVSLQFNHGNWYKVMTRQEIEEMEAGR